MSANDPREIEIPVPWGHIAAQTWGDPKDPVVLTFHGILDNAGSFDRLIPHLPKAFYYVCCDLPGHGRSSHLPPFLPYYTLDNIIVYKLLADYFKQDKYIILGHSYGGQIGLLFAQLYPKLVDRLIMLDTIHLYPVTAHQFKGAIRERLEYIIELHMKMQKGQAPQYTYQEALDKLINQRSHGYLTKEGAEVLLRRALKPTGDGKFSFTLDQRLKSFINPLHDFKYIMETLKKNPVTCPILMVLGRESEIQQIVMKPLLKFMQKNCNLLVKYVDGHHDVHNNKPELVAPYVSKFLLMKQNKL